VIHKDIKPRHLLCDGRGAVKLRNQVLSRAHFVTGKFDQFDRSEPYAALASACRELVRATLSVSVEAFAAKRQALSESLGSSAQVMIDLVPELELIIGAQPPPANLGGVESQNRFEQAFESFLGALVTPDEPLVMALDDLQWADVASLRLLHRVLTARRHSPILIVGTYRDNEVPRVHPLLLELEDLRKDKVEMAEIRLEPLGLDDVSQFVADTLAHPVPEIRPLAAIMFEKTRGNPFHLGQFLEALYREGLIVNAAHAISDAVGTSGKKGRIVVRTFNEGDKVRIEIGDTGCGIAPEIRGRVYDPFFTTKEVGKGSGQGLAIARNIVVEKHGGTLSFESEVGKGTTFAIVLPVDAAKSAG
jgi:hypothetical protein